MTSRRSKSRRIALLAACLATLMLFTNFPVYALFSGGVTGVSATDDLQHYGNEYWIFTSGDQGLPAPVFLGIYPGTIVSSQLLSASDASVSNTYTRFDMNPLTGSVNISILSMGTPGCQHCPLSDYKGVQAGDKFQFTPYSSKAYWYDNGKPLDFGSIKGYNGYEWQGTFTIVRSGTTYSGSGDFEHVWGYNINNALYGSNEIVYEQWDIVVTNQFSGVVWQLTNKYGQTWQDGGLLFLDNGSYNRLGTTVSGYPYSTIDGSNCASFATSIGSSRGQISLNFSSPKALILPKINCTREIVSMTVTGTMAGQALTGWAVVEVQRSGVAPPPPPPPTQLTTTATLSFSPSSVATGGKITASGKLADSNGVGVGGRTVTIQISRDQSTWSTSATLTTQSDGSFSMTGPLPYTLYAKAVFNGDSAYLPSTSPIALAVAT